MWRLAAALAVGVGTAAGQALVGPVECRFAVPADLGVGAAEWIGPCAAGKADGIGVVRVGIKAGGVRMFYGVMKAGVPVEGMLGDSSATGFRVAAGFDAKLLVNETLPAELQQSPKYWKEAASAARVAAKHYAGLGNGASAKFYEGRARELDKGPGE